MKGFLPINCALCKLQSDSTQEQLQEKVASASMTSTRHQSQSLDHLLSEKQQAKETAFKRKMSLKNVKKMNSKQAYSQQSLPKVRLLESSCDSRVVRSPNTKIVITYKPSAFAPASKCEPSAFIAEPIFRLQNRVNYCNSNNEIKNNGPIPIENSILNQSRNTRLNDTNMHLIAEFKQNQNNLERAKSKQPQNQQQQHQPNYKRHKRVNFTGLYQHQTTLQGFKETYSAFGSIVNTQMHIPFGQQEDLQILDKSGFQNRIDLCKVSEIREPRKDETRRITKKQLTCFISPQRKLVGARTVNTIKSIDTPSEGSTLDLKFMQNIKKGMQDRLIEQ